jgi:micrococcal nuclease
MPVAYGPRPGRRASPARSIRQATVIGPCSAAALAGIVGIAACSDPGSPCGPREATVERVIDGDTIVVPRVVPGEVPTEIKIRYLLFDAPEATAGHADCYGASASRFNADLVLGKTIQLAYDARCQDLFGRTLAYVTVDGQDVNRLLIERGYACVLHIPPDGDARADELEALEAAARTARRGLWGACDPIPCK